MGRSRSTDKDLAWQKQRTIENNNKQTNKRTKHDNFRQAKPDGAAAVETGRPQGGAGLEFRPQPSDAFLRARLERRRQFGLLDAQR